MSNYNLNQMGSELSLTLGAAVWAFAQIEKLTYEYIANEYRDSVDDLISELTFRARTRILRKIVKSKKPTPENLKRFNKAINKAEKLSEERNIIVHNPWRIWVDLDEGKFMTEIQKYAQPDKSLNLDQLTRFCATANSVETELRASLNAL